MKEPSSISWGMLETPLGWIGLAATSEGISRILLPQPTEALTAAQLAQDNGGSVSGNQEAVSPWLQELARMLGGTPVDFTGWPLDLRGSTPFQRKVWAATREIPWGQTRSYWWVAVRMGDPYAVRAVGNALGANPLPLVIPCHRVVRSDGSLGGFGGGPEMKGRLLEIECASASLASE